MNLFNYIQTKLKREGKKIIFLEKDKIYFFKENNNYCVYGLDMKKFINIDFITLKKKKLEDLSSQNSIISLNINCKVFKYFYTIKKETNSTELFLFLNKKPRKRILKGIYLGCCNNYIVTRDLDFTYYYNYQDLINNQYSKKIPFENNIINNELNINTIVINNERHYYDEHLNLILKNNLKENSIVFPDKEPIKIPKDLNLKYLDVCYLKGNYLFKNNYIDIYFSNNNKKIMKLSYNRETKEHKIYTAVGKIYNFNNCGIFKKNGESINFKGEKPVKASFRNSIFKNKDVIFNKIISNIKLENSSLNSSFTLRILSDDQLFVDCDIINTELNNIKLLKIILSKKNIRDFYYLESLGCYIIAEKDSAYVFDKKFNLINFLEDIELLDEMEKSRKFYNEDLIKKINLLKFELTKEEILRKKLIIKTGA